MSLTEQLPALQVVVPLLTAPLIVLLRDPRLSWAAAAASSAMTFSIAIAITLSVLQTGEMIYLMGNWPAPYGIELRIDPLSALLLLIISGAASLSLIFGRQSLEDNVGTTRLPLFYAAWLIAVAGLCGIAVTGDAFNVFVFMEISSLASYVLISAGPDRRALTAVFKYLIMGTIGATFYLIGVGLVYMMTGTLNFADMEARIAEVSDQKPILVAAGFITIGLALKAAVFPLHLWLPRAYTYAPHIVTAFLAASSTKVALYVLLRFDFLVFQGNLIDHALQFASFAAPLALLGIMVGTAVAMVEGNLKRLLAYSSVAQVGYILLGASFSDTAGLSAGIVHMFNHALAKGTLFLAVAAFAMRAASLRLEALAGLGRSMPWTSAAFVLAGASLVGIPGTAGFISKWLLLQAAFAQGWLGIICVVIVVLSSLGAVYYIWRVIEQLYFGSVDQARQATTREAPAILVLGIWVGALANVFFGLVPDLPLSLSSSAASDLLRHLP